MQMLSGCCACTQRIACEQGAEWLRTPYPESM